MKLITLTSLTLLSFSPAAQKHSEISSKARANIAQQQLKSNKQTIAIFIKGMICESCGIGIKKKVSKLPFVDRKRLKKGMQLSAKNQLLVLAIKPGSKANYSALNRAIVSAGYTPVQYFVSRHGKIKSFSANGFR